MRQCQELAPEYAKDIAAVMRDTPKTVRRMPYAETWTKYLKSQGYQLYVLSNYSRYMLDRTKKEMPFLKYMDGTVFSCDVKQLKPEADIYQTLLDKFGLKAEECVFIDDRPVNCEGAQKAGIHTICFKSFKQAAAELEDTRRKIKTEFFRKRTEEKPQNRGMGVSPETFRKGRI